MAFSAYVTQVRCLRSSEQPLFGEVGHGEPCVIGRGRAPSLHLPGVFGAGGEGQGRTSDMCCHLSSSLRSPAPPEFTTHSASETKVCVASTLSYCPPFKKTPQDRGKLLRGQGESCLRGAETKVTYALKLSNGSAFRSISCFDQLQVKNYFQTAIGKAVFSLAKSRLHSNLLTKFLCSAPW